MLTVETNRSSLSFVIDLASILALIVDGVGEFTPFSLFKSHAGLPSGLGSGDRIGIRICSLVERHKEWGTGKVLEVSGAVAQVEYLIVPWMIVTRIVVSLVPSAISKLMKGTVMNVSVGAGELICAICGEPFDSKLKCSNGHDLFRHKNAVAEVQQQLDNKTIFTDDPISLREVKETIKQR
jgi:hypothetical protein